MSTLQWGMLPQDLVSAKKEKKKKKKEKKSFCPATPIVYIEC
jgi:hypothetical protein